MDRVYCSRVVKCSVTCNAVLECTSLVGGEREFLFIYISWLLRSAPDYCYVYVYLYTRSYLYPCTYVGTFVHTLKRVN